MNGFNCSCPDGYNGTTCQEDIDECGSDPCENGGTCTDGVNGFNCSCPDGYNGTTCQEDIDECGSDPCENGGTCTDGVNGFNCSCQDGYNGTTCQEDMNSSGSVVEGSVLYLPMDDSTGITLQRGASIVPALVSTYMLYRQLRIEI